MARISYIPRRDRDLAAWALHFAGRVEAGPGVYGLVADDVALIRSYVDAFDAALSLATDPITRTLASVAAKDGARAAMVHVLRGYAQQIRRNRGISNSAKLAQGVNVPDLSRTRQPAPVSAPLIHILAAQPLEQTLCYADANAPHVRAKPVGAAGMQLFVAVGDTPPAGPEQAAFKAFVTRQPFAVPFDADQRGQTAWYFGRWQTETGRVGPWSSMSAMVVA